MMRAMNTAIIDIGIIGLGKMGANMARRLARANLAVAAFDVAETARNALQGEPRVTVLDSLAAIVNRMPTPRALWLMLPAGAITQEAIDQLASLLTAGDTIIDGGNTYYKDSQRRAASLAERGVAFIDAGVSGGVWGLANGYTLTLGGTPEAIARIAPICRALAPRPDAGWMHCGPSGSGHYVKMVHNGIEYGMMQAYAEGFALLEAKTDLALDPAAIAENWRHGSVIRSWLLDLTSDALTNRADLATIKPVVADSGEGRWTAQEAIDLGVPTPVIAMALAMRFASQGNNDYSARLLAMMRNQFGGHAMQSTTPD
jgi:6-phosphogluconate dehydrogenase